MTISKLHYISQGNTLTAHLQNIQTACSSGAELVQLNLNNGSEKELLSCAYEAREITAHFQTRLLISDHYKIAKEVKADGVHLGKIATCPKTVRAHLYTWQIIGATANTLQDCETLLSKEVDYIRLSPFKSSINNNNLPPSLGLNGYTAITESLKTETPIIGIGGITIQDVANILATGVSGIAVSGEITRDFNCIKTFNQLLSASSTEEQRHTF